MPEIFQGDSENGQALFARVDSIMRARIQLWIAKHDVGDYRPTFIRLTRARKELSEISIYPTLGLDPTLPQHKLPNIADSCEPRPGQNEYPVWYFFYGTLANSETLTNFLRLSSPAILRAAKIKGGILRGWGAGKYRALVDGPIEAAIKGSAYHVTSFDHEESLCFYETERYEVVRCSIEMEGGEIVKGLTFRLHDHKYLDPLGR